MVPGRRPSRAGRPTRSPPYNVGHRHRRTARLTPGRLATVVVPCARPSRADRNGLVQRRRRASRSRCRPRPPTRTRRTTPSRANRRPSTPCPRRSATCGGARQRQRDRDVASRRPTTVASRSRSTRSRSRRPAAARRSPCSSAAPQVLCPNGITTDCYRLNVSPLTNDTQLHVRRAGAERGRPQRRHDGVNRDRRGDGDAVGQRVRRSCRPTPRQPHDLHDRDADQPDLRPVSSSPAAPAACSAPRRVPGVRRFPAACAAVACIGQGACNNRRRPEPGLRWPATTTARSR